MGNVFFGFSLGMVALMVILHNAGMTPNAVKCKIGVSHHSPTTGEYVEDSIERRGLDTLIIHRRDK